MDDQQVSKFRLPAKLNKELLGLAGDLNGTSELLNRRYVRQTLAWKESDEGVMVNAWLEDLDQLIEAMNDFAEVVTDERVH